MAKMELDFEDLFKNPVQTEVIKEETTAMPVVGKKRTIKPKVDVSTQRKDVPITSQGSQHTFVIREELWLRLKEYSKSAGVNLVNIINASIERYLDGEK